MRAALAAQPAGGPRPGVIVIHEITGLNDDIREKAERIAGMGYAALAPDLYSTRGPMPICILRTMRGLGGGEGPVIADLDACRAWLAARPEVDGSQVGVVGFCMGGGIATLYAARGEPGAAAVFYGDVPKDAGAFDGACPMLGGFGGRDRFFGKMGNRLERHLEQAGVAHDVKTYPDAGHSYMNQHAGLLGKVSSWGPLKVGFNADAAEDSWKRIDAFFAEHLGGTRG